MYLLSKVDNVFHPVLLKYHGHCVAHPVALPQQRAFSTIGEKLITNTAICEKQIMCQEDSTQPLIPEPKSK